MISGAFEVGISSQKEGTITGKERERVLSATKHTAVARCCMCTMIWCLFYIFRHVKPNAWRLQMKPLASFTMTDSEESHISFCLELPLHALPSRDKGAGVCQIPAKNCGIWRTSKPRVDSVQIRNRGRYQSPRRLLPKLSHQSLFPPSKPEQWDGEGSGGVLSPDTVLPRGPSFPICSPGPKS